MDVLLLHPPATKPAEPPLGVAVLLAHLRARGLRADALDASLGACLHLLEPENAARAAGASPSTSLRRSLGHLPESLVLLRSPAALASAPRYQTAVRHINTVLGAYGGDRERLTLGDYGHETFSPFAPADLERFAAGEAATLFAPYFREVLLPQVEALRPRVVALSVNFLHQALPAFELAGLLRRALPGVAVIGGGGLFTSWRQPLRQLQLRFSCFDRLVLGPGEEVLAALAEGRAGDDYLLEGGAEVAFVPDFSFAAPADYLSPVPVLPVAASRGCYWGRCLFCPEASAPTHPYAAPAPATLPALLRGLSEQYGVRHFHLTDNAIPVSALRALAANPSEMSELRWHGFVRFEPALLDPAFVRALAAAGCALLQLGLESGSQRVLDRLGKGTELATAARILENLRAAGIASYVYVLLGTPGEEESDAEATLAFLEEHADAIGYLNLAIMNLPRDSAMLADPQAFGIAAAGEPDVEEPLGLYLPFAPQARWDRAAARRFLDRRLLASPVIRAIVQRTPPLFTSNHAFLFPPPKALC